MIRMLFEAEFYLKPRGALRKTTCGKPMNSNGFGNVAGVTPAGVAPAGVTPAGATPAGVTPAGVTPAGVHCAEYHLV